ncbi:M56 family metallopeptidase [Saccharopolyspora sp. SCSIO 74807]|uniref:M56 family metallopeptidase n=1 Tax=Saccharopolyspora sp. SCSIO 74807 TaxID=3118084 RepID=UPI0030D44A26
MTSPAVGLLCGAALVATVAPSLLHRQRGLLASPRLGLVAWFGAAGAVLTMLAVAGPVTLVAPRVDVFSVQPQGLTSFLAGCVGLLHRPGLISLGSAVLATGLTGYTCVVLAAHVHRTRQASHDHRAELAEVGRVDPGSGTILVPYARPVCYCLAGSPSRIVLSTGARDTLSARELDAMLAHERAHLAGHHHALLTLARGLARALPVVPLFRALPQQVELLVERLADERAGTRCGRGTVARALLRMVDHAVPGAALGATGGDLTTRMTYLLHPAPVTRTGRPVLLLSPAIAVAIALGPTAVLTLACVLSWAP